jgi:hypothetical protein
MFKKFYEGDFNIRRLNYGLISLIPKMKEVHAHLFVGSGLQRC